MKARRTVYCHRIHLTKIERPRKSFLLKQGADFYCTVQQLLLFTATIYPAVNSRDNQTISLFEKVYIVTVCTLGLYTVTVYATVNKKLTRVNSLTEKRCIL